MAIPLYTPASMAKGDCHTFKQMDILILERKMREKNPNNEMIAPENTK